MGTIDIPSQNKLPTRFKLNYIFGVWEYPIFYKLGNYFWQRVYKDTKIWKVTFVISILCGLLVSADLLYSQEGVGEGVIGRNEFTLVKDSENVKILLKYASSDNFMQENLYGKFTSCYLHKEAYLKFQKAIQLLKSRKSKWKFILYDCLRPRSVQNRLWEKVKGTDQEPYVANPEKGSIHNFGFAIDVSLLNESGEQIDMGTEFDDFTPLAEPTKEEKFIREGKLTKLQVGNRRILRSILIEAGFTQRPNEWWHYDAISSQIVKKRYKIVE
ncbi:MAG: M15 family metallopeptidase [Leptospiraceae bacterium]|nr:M15 family metallopeptidase [Leptospiraceae bacterium]